MTAARTELVALFGTDEALPETRLLRAGPLSAMLEDGNLRAIRFDGVEMVRAVNYVARDGDWGTYKSALANVLVVEESTDAFEVSYDALCAGPEGRYSYRMKIRGEAAGSLVMTAEGEALTDFPTNRIGFVVLHPAEAAGGKLEIRHSDRTVEKTAFPDQIAPDQPAFDITALTHQPAHGMTCTVAMEGDAFEMEDQRNWADASFKTYVRPLSKPRPYVIPAGERDIQRITITVEGNRRERRPGRASDELTIAIGEPIGTMPSIALFLDDEEPLPESVSRFGASEMIVRCDPLREDATRRLIATVTLATAAGLRLAVEAVFDCRDAEAEARAFAAILREAGLTPSAVLVSPRREFRTRPTGMLPSGEQPVDAIVAALRETGLGVPIGAGTPSFFTEFNRNPPGQAADFVFFGISSNVHAADDMSIMETLSVYPTIIESAGKLCPGKPLWLGPCTLGMRHNPYGAGVAANPDRVRKPGARYDPRQEGQFAAAFMVGVVAKAIGVERLVLAAPSGPFGLARVDGTSRPCAAVHALLAAGAKQRRLSMECPDASIACLAFGDGGRLNVLVANLSDRPRSIKLADAPSELMQLSDMPSTSSGLSKGDFVLGPYQTLLLSGKQPGQAL